MFTQPHLPSACTPPRPPPGLHCSFCGSRYNPLQIRAPRQQLTPSATQKSVTGLTQVPRALRKEEGHLGWRASHGTSLSCHTARHVARVSPLPYPGV